MSALLSDLLFCVRCFSSVVVCHIGVSGVLFFRLHSQPLGYESLRVPLHVGLWPTLQKMCILNTVVIVAPTSKKYDGFLRQCR